MKKRTKIILGIILTIFLIGIGFILYTFHFLNQVNKVESWDTSNEKESKVTKSTTIDYSTYLTKVKDVSHILLLGEENIEESKEGTRGRTDCMILLTINKNINKIKLTSLMRDTYVNIPNHNKNKLNAAYQLGGVPLLKETISYNYGIPIDGTVLVQFEDLIKIIDILDGIDIELSAEESNYLNESNYIDGNHSKLKEGMNHMTGNMALGYCRIRYVETKEHLLNDFGRTNRQRIVLNAIFEKYKSKSITELLPLLEKILHYIDTDISKTQMIGYLVSALKMMPLELDTFSLPIENGYTDKSFASCGQVLDLDWKKNLIAFHEFLEDNVSEYEIENYLEKIMETTKNKQSETSQSKETNILNKESNPIKSYSIENNTEIVTNNSSSESTTIVIPESSENSETTESKEETKMMNDNE